MHPLVICLFLNLFVCHPFQLQAQRAADTVYFSKTASLPAIKKYGPVFSGNDIIDDKLPSLPKLTVLFLRPLAADHYSAGLGFFCSKEIQIEKITKIPFRFRLGSVAYTDYMEGKPTAAGKRPF